MSISLPERCLIAESADIPAPLLLRAAAAAFGEASFRRRRSSRRSLRGGFRRRALDRTRDETSVRTGAALERLAVGDSGLRASRGRTEYPIRPPRNYKKTKLATNAHAIEWQPPSYAIGSRVPALAQFPSRKEKPGGSRVERFSMPLRGSGET